jgi:hypothetical protein
MFLAMHFEKKMTYAEIAKATGKSKLRVRQLVRKGCYLWEKGCLQIKDGKVRLQNGEDVIKDDL